MSRGGLLVRPDIKTFTPTLYVWLVPPPTSYATLCIVWCNEWSDQHRPEYDLSCSVMVIADSLYVSGGLSKTQLRNKNDTSSCFRPLCTGSASDTRVVSRTVQCVSCKLLSISPTSSVDAACQIQLQRSFWDFPGTALQDRKQWMFSPIIYTFSSSFHLYFRSEEFACIVKDFTSFFCL